MLKTHQKVYLFLKRVIDIFGSLVGIVVLSPLILICMIVTKCTSKGPIFFRQARLGKNEKEFKCWKFRSMKVGSKQTGAQSMTKEEQAAMITKWGALMRKTSLDEIPQLFNIFAGQMSFIGPRPGLIRENEPDLVQARESVQPSPYLVKPGLSGYSQIMLKRNNDVNLRAINDSYYVKHLSFWLDIKIFVLSFLVLFGFDPGR